MKTLYVSDMDGTLLQPDARLSERTVSMLNEAISSGKLFTVATARTPATVAPLMERVDMNIPAIVMTGAALWNPADGRYSRLRLMDPEAARLLLGVYRSQNCPSFIYSLRDNMITIRHTGPMSELQREFADERAHTPYKRIVMDADGHSEFPDVLDDIILTYSMLPNEPAERAYEVTRNLPGIRAQFYHDIYGEQTAILEAFSPEATKAKAMKALARQLGADRIVAFGDNINDLPMMHEADLAVAVANARDEVKDAAHIVIGPNSDDSVARFILNGC